MIELLSRIRDFEILARSQNEVEMKRRLTAFHLRQRDKIVQEQSVRSGHAPNVQDYANFPGNPIANLTLPGPIVSEFSYHLEIVKVAMAMLKSGGPHDSGEYKKSHRMYLNGSEIFSPPLSLRVSDEVLILNIAPYARRLEVGLEADGTTFARLKSDSGWYRQTQVKLAEIYKNAAHITYAFALIPGGGRRSARLSNFYISSNGVRRRRQQHLGELQRHPAIKIRMIDRG